MINVLQENATLKRELHSLSSKQQKENRKNILYYRGLSSYSGIDRTNSASFKYKNSSSEKNIYEKKGIKFKLNTEKQEEKLKEIQSQEKENKEKITPTIENIPPVQEKKEKAKPQKQDNHNRDAE